MRCPISFSWRSMQLSTNNANIKSSEYKRSTTNGSTASGGDWQRRRQQKNCKGSLFDGIPSDRPQWACFHLQAAGYFKSVAGPHLALGPDFGHAWYRSLGSDQKMWLQFFWAIICHFETTEIVKLQTVLCLQICCTVLPQRLTLQFQSIDSFIRPGLFSVSQVTCMRVFNAAPLGRFLCGHISTESGCWENHLEI